MAKGRKKHTKSNDLEEFNDQEPEETENFLTEVVPKWYDQLKSDGQVQCEPLTEEELNSLRAEAEQILQQEASHYHSKERKGKSGHDAAWLKTMLTKGTSKDKIGAHILSVQNAPQFNLTQLHSLINMVKASKQRECISVMENLVDLFLEDLLIPDRKLKTFDKQPLAKLYDLTSGCARTRKNKLLFWMFEEKLKESYQTFISSINAVAKDTVEANRMKAVSAMNRLLSGHPEQEQLLLKNIVNKLGDPNQKVVSKVIYNLTQLLRVHPNMKQVVLNEVEKFLFRPNLNKKAQYYSICFLTQYVFQTKDRDIARNIINIYFSFFKAAIKKGEIDSKLMGALLVGVKRAHPFAKLNSDVMKEHTDTLYKLVHLTPFNISIHALCLLQEVSTASDDRFYSALYKKLLDPDISKSCHQAIFINLLYKAIMKDSNIARLKAIIKRLFQVCLSVPSPLACAFLYLISQILSKRRQLLAFQTEPQQLLPTIKIEDEDDDDDGEEKYFDAEDTTDVKNGLKKEIEENDKERLSPKLENSDTDIKIKEEPIETTTNTEGWVFKNLIKQRKTNLGSGVYDPLARNPMFANADKSAYFELINLSRHFHPSVALFAHKIFTSERIVYSGDPLADFTLVRFLDRFCFKNPKKLDEELKGPDPTLAQRKYYKPSGVKSIPVLSQSYLSQDRTNIPVDELFLYKYLKDKHGSGEKFTKKKDEDEDNESVASEDFEEMIQGMMGGKKTKNLDFMEDVGDNLKKKKGAKEKDEDEISVDEEAEEENEDDEDSEASDNGEERDENDVGDNDDDEVDDDVMDFEDGIDGEAIDFSDDGEDDDDIDLDNEFFNKEDTFKKSSSKIKKEKLKSIKKVKGLKTKGGLDGLFAPAEEFAEILEEAGASKEKPGMIQSMSNTDNSAPKQLAWESKRDRWVRDLDSRKRKHKNLNNNMKFNKSKKRRKNF